MAATLKRARHASLSASRKARKGYRQSRLRLANLSTSSPGPTGGGGLVVSMTSFHARIRRCYLALESILSGSVLPGRLCLWLADGDLQQADALPELRRLRDRGLEIRLAAPDFRPGNKLVHALATSPDAVIVIADDDLLYPKRWLEQLLVAHRRSPDAIVSHACHRLTARAEREVVPYLEAKANPGTGTVPSFALLALGYSGVLFPPGALDPRVHDHELFTALTPNNDDLWFKAMSLLAGTRTGRVAERNATEPLGVSSGSAQPLSKMNLAGENDAAIRRLFDHFDLYRYLFMEE